MKKYAYARVSFSDWNGKTTNDHRRIIDEHAQKGYRYVGYIPTRVGLYGQLREVDLVFEMSADDPWAAQ